MLQKAVLVNGNWSKKDGKLTGNFSGYSVKYGRIHVYAAQMEALGFKVGEPVGTLYAMVDTTKEVTTLDDKGNEIPGSEKVRPTAMFIFKTEDEMHKAGAAENLLAANERRYLKAQAADAGLSESEVADLLATL